MAVAEMPDRQFPSRGTSSDHFAWLRTRLAAERTLLAWSRTSIALIGFGFTIVKFFETLASVDGFGAARYPHAARYLGLLLIAAGTAAGAIALWEYRGMVRYLWQEQFQSIAGLHETPAHTPAMGIAVVILFIGVFAFVSIVFRMG